DGRASGRVSRAGADDLNGRPSSRTYRTGDGDLDGRTSSRSPYPGEGDLDGRASGRVSRAGADDLNGRPSSRTYRTGDGDLGGRTSSRTLRTGDGDLTDRPSGRVPRTGAGDLADRPSGRVPRGEDTGVRIPRPTPASGSGSGEAAGVRGAGALPRLVVLVDDFDALVAPALGAPGRPAAGSVVRALEAVARHGERLGVHLVVASARPDRTADTEPAHSARLRIVLDAPPVTAGPDVPAAGRGRLGHPDGRVTPFQTGRVTGRIPRTATLRPTVVPLEWERMGDPPTRRPVRELGNGPTDLALLASALDRATRSVEATPVPPLSPVAHT
ncbi:hypothetical protein ACFUT5_22735, partial [Streptomyces cinereoruber]